MTSPTLAPPLPLSPPSTLTTLDLVERLGEVPLSRICTDPFPGTATEQDAYDLHAKTHRLFELVAGVLVEKAMGAMESFLAGALFTHLRLWVASHNLGAVLPADGILRLAPGVIRIPDISFIPWSQIPGRRLDPNTPIPDLFPDLAVEVLSTSNTASEMAAKRSDYLNAGTRLVWQVDPRARTVEVFTGPTASALLQQTDTLTGDPVLPGFSLPLAQLFAELDPH